MTSSARTGGLGRKLALAGAAAICTAISWSTIGLGTADASQTASASAYHPNCVKLKRRAKANRSHGGKPPKRKTIVCPPTSGDGQAGTGGGAGGTGGETTPPPGGSCRTADPGTTSDFLAPRSGSSLIWRDDCSSTNPIPLYGAFVGGRNDGRQNMFTSDYSQIAPGRLARLSSGGPGDLPYRQITVHPEDYNWSAARDALGYNWSSPEDAGWGIQGPGPTVLWHEGEYHMFTTWVKLGAINNSGYFRQLFELKQSEPYNEDPFRGAMFELQQREGQWKAICEWTDTWSIPVTQSPNTWVPISVEGFFTDNPNTGWIRFKIGNQTSPTFHQRTLLKDTSTGASVPSFLEMGPYQDQSLPQFSFGFADARVYG